MQRSKCEIWAEMYFFLLSQFHYYFFDIHREKQTDIEAESLDLLKTNEKCDQQPAKKSTLRGIYRQVCK